MIQIVQSARAIRDYFAQQNDAALKRIPPRLRWDTQLFRGSLEGCSGAAEAQQWLQSLINIAAVVNPALNARELQEIWTHVGTSPCFQSLPPMGKAWVSLFAAVGARDARQMANIGNDILPRSGSMSKSWRGYALAAAMAGNVALDDRSKSSQLWTRYAPEITKRADAEELLFRLLNAHSTGEMSTR